MKTASERPREDRPRHVPTILLGGARGLALVSLVLSGYLLWVTVSADGKIAGCGGEAGRGCADLFASRWSYWFGMPVSLPAVLVYALVLACLFSVAPDRWPVTRQRAWRALIAVAPLLIGAAFWFTFLQLMRQTFCVYCLTIHVCGVLLAGFILRYCPVSWNQAVARRGGTGSAIPARAARALLLAGLSGAFLLAGAQILVDPPVGMVIGEDGPLADARVKRPGVSAKEAVPLPQDPPAEPARKEGGPDFSPPAGASALPATPPARKHRTITILRGRIELDAYGHPCAGSPEAEHVVVEMFDYTCAQCRSTHRYLQQARERYGEQLSFLLVPVPMNSACNRHVRKDRPEHEEACELARLALAVWTVDPEAFAELHAWLLERDAPPTFATARTEAAQRIGQEALSRALASSVTDRLLEENVRLYGEVGGGQIPKLFAERTFAIGEPQSASQLFSFFEQRVGLRPASP